MAEATPARPRRRLPDVATLVATGLGSGYAPVAPGTAGSLLGLLLFWPVSVLPLVAQLLVVAAVSVTGALAGTRVASRLGRKDPGLVVVDEVAGMWVTLLALPFTLRGALLGFLFFRVMDIVKPFPARRLEGLAGGWGIMADDLMAGVYANLLLRLVLLAWPFA